MKIIKHGKKPEPKKMQCDCPTCGCVFEPSTKDCTEIGCKKTDDGKLELVAYGITCPECGEKVVLFI